ncbi:sodium/potassium/calcium exchanger 3-like [Tachysurus fulvidraco]|uniref:sodium/potassium/calcium exchanger 3-like n=1 Tax=Tachysurus fulvidraco TaxID=1234273 RepID=UPI001FED740C|nr:sodium/potassium/calcium exchanger 3-like [Tachysurus fulvidraco]
MYVGYILITIFNSHIQTFFGNEPSSGHERENDNDIQLRGVEEESNTGDADLSTDDPGEGTSKDDAKKSTDDPGKGTIKDYFLCVYVEGCMKKTKWLVSWPLLLLLFLTIPNCSRTRWEKYLIVVFLLISTVWIAVFSYLMVWMVTIIRYTFGIPDVIMDITVLAIGTSIPDFFTSLTAARQGLSLLFIHVEGVLGKFIHHCQLVKKGLEL